MKTDINDITPRLKDLNDVPVYLMPESLITDDHRPICKHFGCGKVVNDLYNRYCPDHQHRTPIDPTLIIKL